MNSKFYQAMVFDLQKKVNTYFSMGMGGKKVKYGYVRVSTKEQNVDRQISAILEEGIEINKIYIDKASGKRF